MEKIKLPSWKPSPQAFSQTLDDDDDDDDLRECVYVFRRNSKETELDSNPDLMKDKSPAKPDSALI